MRQKEWVVRKRGLQRVKTITLNDKDLTVSARHAFILFSIVEGRGGYFGSPALFSATCSYFVFP